VRSTSWSNSGAIGTIRQSRLMASRHGSSAGSAVAGVAKPMGKPAAIVAATMAIQRRTGLASMSICLTEGGGKISGHCGELPLPRVPVVLSPCREVEVAILPPNSSIVLIEDATACLRLVAVVNHG